ncbi:MAG: thioredoxin domain-containing protein [Thaumarchaeota archaeon]|nr:thioredoxin domain-containing protein [Nitrososphaerota archaeon]
MTPNSLANETSPYLLQHAQNPVEWFAWNDTSLQKAKNENKPIFLSIGYSACHWCHVMAHESFENKEIANIMNEYFVNIKVDREERPDIDDIYQKVCQTATGQGGWPLSIFLTPEQEPFYVGTYFPILDSHGRPGFGSILRRLAQIWRENPKDVKKSASDYIAKLKTERIVSNSKADRPVLDEAAMNLFQLGDPTYGGFGNAPKFPSTANISFLFRYAKISGISKFTDFGLKTLKKMAKGGIFDQIGGGFHRYSTDARWLVPHFEKMLYDNALLPINYAEAYQITGERFYLDVMQKTLDFVLREMTSSEGAFYSAFDADSEGVEGRYYVWNKSQIKQILGKDADMFCLFYDVTDGGNWEGNSILCNNIDISAVAFHFGVSEKQAKEKIDACTKKLLAARAKRVMPGLDDKILTSWNSLMITAFAKGYRVTGDVRYLDAAIQCISFIRKNMTDGVKLLRTYKNGTAKIDGYLEDYSYFACALLDIFEVYPEPEYLELAQKLGVYMIDHFWDEDMSSFFMTSDKHERLIIRPKNNHDLSLPSGNSVACNLLFRLYHLVREEKFLDTSVRIMNSLARSAAENPFGYGHLLNTIFMHIQGMTEVTILHHQDNVLCHTLDDKFLPECVVVSFEDESHLEKLSQYLFFSGKSFEDETSVYICKDSVCSLPLYTISEVESKL